MHPDIREAIAALSTYEIMGVKGSVNRIRRLCHKLHPLRKGTLSERLGAVEAHLDVERGIYADAADPERGECAKRIAKLRRLRRTLLDKR